MPMKFTHILIIIVTLFGCGKERNYEYYDNGALKSSAEISNGLYDGYYIEYYEDGKIKSKEFWERGQLNGLIKRFYPSGKLKIYANVENYKMIFYEEYYESGTLKQKQLFDQLGKIREIELYKENSVRDSLVYPLFGMVNGDTIKLGESALFAVKLYNILDSIYQHGHMIITSDFDSLNVFTDTLCLVYPDKELYYEYKFTPEKLGKSLLRGSFVFTDTLKNGYTDRILYQFEYGYFVAP